MGRAQWIGERGLLVAAEGLRTHDDVCVMDADKYGVQWFWAGVRFGLRKQVAGGVHAHSRNPMGITIGAAERHGP